MIQSIHRLPPDFVAQPHLDRDHMEDGNVPPPRTAYDSGIPYTVGIVAEWPVTVQFNDGKLRTYYRTGKLGSWADNDPMAPDDPDCTPCAEYQCREEGQDRRVWLLLSGELNHLGDFVAAG